MMRQIIRIDREKCSGCGLCARACHEQAIEIRDGKAVLVREDFCDGMGDCLPHCPQDAITFENREADAYSAEAVKEHKAERAAQAEEPSAVSQLGNWPVQLRLAPVQAAYYRGADLMIAADCTAYACADFHQRYMKKRVTLIGCPKLDQFDYAEKLEAILKYNEIRSVLFVRMEVPCCGRLAEALETAVRNSGRNIPARVEVIQIH